MNIELALSLAALCIKASEGFCANAYLDHLPKVPLWTIGFGTTRIAGKPVQPGQTCTMAQASAWCAQDMRADLAWVMLRVMVPLAEREAGALTSLCYNIGHGPFAESSVVAALNKGLRRVAADRFLEYDHAGGVVVRGLTTRRERERAMFLIGSTNVALVPSAIVTLKPSPAPALSADALNDAELSRLAAGG